MPKQLPMDGLSVPFWPKTAPASLRAIPVSGPDNPFRPFIGPYFPKNHPTIAAHSLHKYTDNGACVHNYSEPFVHHFYLFSRQAMVFRPMSARTTATTPPSTALSAPIANTSVAPARAPIRGPERAKKPTHGHAQRLRMPPEPKEQAAATKKYDQTTRCN